MASKSPFPGMDPYIEARGLWGDFHNDLITSIKRFLNSQLPPRYVARGGERSYIDAVDLDGERLKRRTIIPDVSVHERATPATPHSSTAAVEELTDESVVMYGTQLEEIRESFIDIRDVETDNRLVTSIEILSPTNKRPNSKGWVEYESKRNNFFRGIANLVEIDLLRGGRRLPMGSPLPAGHYMAIVSRGRLRPKSSVYSWRLSGRMPAIPIPLAARDAEPMLDLQTVLDLVYDRAHYHRSLKYATPPVPPLSPEMADWTQSILNTRSSPSTP